MPKTDPKLLYKQFPDLTPSQRKKILDSKQRSAIKVLIDCMMKLLKELYCHRYEAQFPRKCIWRWNGKGDAHWREMARNVIEFEVDPEQFMEYAWSAKPTSMKYPPLNWLKSMLTVERSKAWEPIEGMSGVNWHESREYHRHVKDAKEMEHKIASEERRWNAQR